MDDHEKARIEAEDARAKQIEEDVKDGNEYYTRGYTLFESLLMANTTLREEFAVALTWGEEQALDKIKRSTRFRADPDGGGDTLKLRVAGICTPDTVMLAGPAYCRPVTLKELLGIYQHRNKTLKEA